MTLRTALRWSGLTWNLRTGLTFSVGPSSPPDPPPEPPVNPPTDIILDNDRVLENALDDTLIGTFTAVDADPSDTHTYVMLDNAGGRFYVVGHTGELKVLDGTLLDHETNPSHNIHVEVTDSGGLKYDKWFTIFVDNVAESPVDITPDRALTVPENTANGVLVAVFTASDPDSTVFTWDLTDSAGGRFSIETTTGTLRVANGALLDFETATSHNITVRVRDPELNPYSEQFTVQVTNVNEAPTDILLSGDTVLEDAPNGTVVGTFTTVDPDGAGDTHTYTLTNDYGGAFAVGLTTGVLTVADNTLLDSASSPAVIQCRTEDQGALTHFKNFNITLLESNVAPTDLVLTPNSVNEAQPPDTRVGDVLVTDPDVGDSWTFSLTNDAGGRFNIKSDTGEVTTAAVLDYETAVQHIIRIKVVDQGLNEFEKDQTVFVNDINEAPTDIALDNNVVNENSANGTVIGTFTPTDPDASETWTWTLPDDALGRFAVNLNTGVLTVLDGTRLDHESDISHNITVRVTDSGGLFFNKVFAILVADVNEAPTDITLTNDTVTEDAANGTLVGTAVATDPDAGDTHTWSLVDTAGGAFAIDNVSGAVTVANNTLLDATGNPTMNITVRATDSGFLTFDKNITINVTGGSTGVVDWDFRNTDLPSDFTHARDAGAFYWGAGEVQRWLPENGMFQSADLTDPVWDAPNVTVTPGQSDPDGGSSAFLVTAGTGLGSYNIGQSVQTGWVWALDGKTRLGACLKRNGTESPWVSLVMFGLSFTDVTAWANVNLTAGTLGSSSANVTAMVPESLGDDWYYCEFEVTHATALGNPPVFHFQQNVADVAPGDYTAAGESFLIFQPVLYRNPAAVTGRGAARAESGASYAYPYYPVYDPFSTDVVCGAYCYPPASAVGLFSRGAVASDPGWSENGTGTTARDAADSFGNAAGATTVEDTGTGDIYQVRQDGALTADGLRKGLFIRYKDLTGTSVRQELRNHLRLGGDAGPLLNLQIDAKTTPPGTSQRTVAGSVTSHVRKVGEWIEAHLFTTNDTTRNEIRAVAMAAARDGSWGTPEGAHTGAIVLDAVQSYDFLDGTHVNHMPQEVLTQGLAVNPGESDIVGAFTPFDLTDHLVEIWVQIITPSFLTNQSGKMFATLYNAADALPNGNPRNGVRFLTGGTSQRFDSQIIANGVTIITANLAGDFYNALWEDGRLIHAEFQLVPGDYKARVNGGAPALSNSPEAMTGVDAFKSTGLNNGLSRAPVIIQRVKITPGGRIV